MDPDRTTEGPAVEPTLTGIGEGFRARYSAENHDSLDDKLLALMVQLSWLPPVAREDEG